MTMRRDINMGMPFHNNLVGPPPTVPPPVNADPRLNPNRPTGVTPPVAPPVAPPVIHPGAGTADNATFAQLIAAQQARQAAAPGDWYSSSGQNYNGNNSYTPSYQEMQDAMGSWGAGRGGYNDPAYQALLKKFGGDQGSMNQWINNFQVNPAQHFKDYTPNGYASGGATVGQAPVNNPTTPANPTQPPVAPPPGAGANPTGSVPPPIDKVNPGANIPTGGTPTTNPGNAITNGMSGMSKGTGLMAPPIANGGGYHFGNTQGDSYAYRTNPGFFKG